MRQANPEDVSRPQRGNTEAVGGCSPPNFKSIPYLSEQLIPYIGNKRRLLPLLWRSIKAVVPGDPKGKSFLDLFAGSGAVSRLAKYMGFSVWANDWEPYARLLNYVYLHINPGDLTGMFSRWGGIDDLLPHLNNLPPCEEERAYISRFFCPRDDLNPDYRTERLFYTRENGLRLDAVREWIEAHYPDEPQGETGRREKALLLALLVHQAATHTNTSGVFKAYHKGFGGFSGDALGRIMRPINLPPPVLHESHHPMRVFGEDANALAGRLDHCFDIVYLDPPYNQHQYGSNYHLLNSLVLWDKPLHRSPEAGKAAIRRDWVKTRSAYCYRDSAAHVFASLLESLKARYILVSYSTEGIIPFSDMVDLCSSRGKVIILTDQYTRYRGGRQSPGRVNSNIEMVLIVDTERTSSRTDLGRIQDMVRTRELNLQAGRWYRSAKLRNSFLVDEAGESIGFQVDATVLWMKTSAFVRIQEPDLGGMLDELPVSAGARRSAKERLADMLRGCECSDRGEELEELIRVVRSAHPAGDALVSEMPRLLRKIAHRKYRDRFEQLLKRVRDVETHRPDRYARIREKVNQVEALAQRRFRG